MYIAVINLMYPVINELVLYVVGHHPQYKT